jgi:hypothetical protein
MNGHPWTRWLHLVGGELQGGRSGRIHHCRTPPRASAMAHRWHIPRRPRPSGVPTYVGPSRGNRSGPSARLPPGSVLDAEAGVRIPLPDSHIGQPDRIGIEGRLQHRAGRHVRRARGPAPAEGADRRAGSGRPAPPRLCRAQRPRTLGSEWPRRVCAVSRSTPLGDEGGGAGPTQIVKRHVPMPAPATAGSTRGRRSPSPLRPAAQAAKAPRRLADPTTGRCQPHLRVGGGLSDHGGQEPASARRNRSHRPLAVPGSRRWR